MSLDVIELSSSSESEDEASSCKRSSTDRGVARRHSNNFKPPRSSNALRRTPVAPPPDVIELTDSSESESDIPNRKQSPHLAKLPSRKCREYHETKFKLNAVLCPPSRSTDKPIHLPETPIKPSNPLHYRTLVADPTPAALRIFDSTRAFPPPVVPATPHRRTVPSTPKTSRKAPATPRVGSKKALAAVAQAERAAYATTLFAELNESVFASGLPKETALIWSNRLLSTAGRARWRRAKDGAQTTEIELATKILDSEERIRNTLSHEMCHLACWVINGDSKEGHGRAWKAWASKVMRHRSEIEISTKHHYEISYPFQWECDNCAKIYGRFSKSIRPEEVLCGVCKTGRLEPLFTTRTRASTASPSKKPSRKQSVKNGTGPAVEELLHEIAELHLDDVDDCDQTHDDFNI